MIANVMENSKIDSEIVFSAADFADRNTVDWTVSKRRLRGGLQEGVELIEVDNGKLQFTVIPTRGMSIYRAECGDVSLGWNSPVKQIVNPQFIDLNDHGGLGWLAGFNEMVVRCGVAWAGHPGQDNGQMLTLHGRIGNIPASQVSVVIDEQAPHRIRVRGLVEEKVFKFGLFELWTEVSTVPGSHEIQITDRLINQSEYEQEYQIIYHANFGRPILEKDAKFVAPVNTVAPFDDYAAGDLDTYQTYLGPTKDYGEQVYCLTLHADDSNITTVMLRNAAGDRGVSMSYNVTTLPCFTLWKNTDTETDGYVTGLEPASGFPYNRGIERDQGRVPKLTPGGKVEFNVAITVLPDSAAVGKTLKRIHKLQGGGEAAIT